MRLRQLTADNPQQQQRLDALEPLLAEKLDELKETIELQSEKGFEAAAEVVLTNRGKKVMDEARRVVAAKENEERGLLISRDAQARARGRNTERILIGGEVLSILLLLAVVYLLSRKNIERRRAEESLRESEERFRDLFEEAPVAYHEIDCEGIVRRVNRAECTLFGYEAQDILGKAAWHFMEPEEREPARQGLRRKIRGEEPVGILHRRYIRPDGTPLILEIHPSLTRDAEGAVTGMRATFLDITDRKRAEQELKQRTAELAAANQELEAFTYSVAHDLRAPLRHIEGFAKLLALDYGGQLDAAAHRYLERVCGGTREMGQLIDDLLNLSRLGRRELVLQATSLKSLVEEVMVEVEPGAAGRRIEWKIQPLPFVECDPALMKQVFNNLLSNAIKYTQPRERAVIEVGAVNHDGGTAIFVRDNGSASA